MPLRVVGGSKMSPEERKFRLSLEEEYARYLHGIVDELFNIAYDKDWSWPQIAQMAGVSYGTVLKLGNRETRYPRHMTVWKMAKAVGLKYEMVYPPALMAKMKRKVG